MSNNSASRSASGFIADHFPHGFLITVGFALAVLAAIVSATTRGPWALAVGLLAFTMFVAGRADCQAGTRRVAARSSRSRRNVDRFFRNRWGKTRIGSGSHRLTRLRRRYVMVDHAESLEPDGAQIIDIRRPSAKPRAITTLGVVGGPSHWTDVLATAGGAA